ncbi:MAG: hypothetical protein WBP61_15650 [Nocardioides sp.]
MAKRTAFLHIGLPRSGGGFLDAALIEHAESLAELGVQHPAISAEEMFRAAIEIRRDHAAWGYQRREVEGAWAGICRRIQRGRDDVVVSQELLAGCTSEQVALLLDGLPGFEIHVIVTAREPGSQLLPGSAAPDLGEVLATWGAAVGAPNRLHVIVVPEEDPEAAVWAALGGLVGFDDVVLPLAAPRPSPRPLPRRPYAELLEVGERWTKQLADGGYDIVGDPHALLPVDRSDDVARHDAPSTNALADVLAEVVRLRAHNQVLAEQNAKLERKKKKLKRRLAASA